MSSPLPDGMMRTSGGARITARPESDSSIVLVTWRIETRLTLDDSHALRDLLQAAELRAARGDVIT